MLNERHLGNPGLALMQQLIAVKPEYDNGIVAFRSLMKKRGIVLLQMTEESNELVNAFNSGIPEEDFSQKLLSARDKAPKDVAYLVRLIKKQLYAL